MGFCATCARGTVQYKCICASMLCICSCSEKWQFVSLHPACSGQLGILSDTADRQHAERTKCYDKSIKHEGKEIKDCHLVVRLKITLKLI